MYLFFCLTKHVAFYILTVLIEIVQLVHWMERRKVMISIDYRITDQFTSRL